MVDSAETDAMATSPAAVNKAPAPSSTLKTENIAPRKPSSVSTVSGVAPRKPAAGLASSTRTPLSTSTSSRSTTTSATSARTATAGLTKPPTRAPAATATIAAARRPTTVSKLAAGSDTEKNASGASGDEGAVKSMLTKSTSGLRTSVSSVTARLAGGKPTSSATGTAPPASERRSILAASTSARPAIASRASLASPTKPRASVGPSLKSTSSLTPASRVGVTPAKTTPSSMPPPKKILPSNGTSTSTKAGASRDINGEETARVQQELADKTSESEKLAEALKEAEGQVQHWKARCEDLDAQKPAEESEGVSAERIDAAKAEAVSAAEAAHAEKLAGLQAEVDSLQTAIASSRQHLETTRSDHEATVSGLNSQVDELQKSLDQHTSDSAATKTTYEADVTALRAERDNLLMESQAHQVEVQTSRGETESLKSAHAATVAGLNTVLEQLRTAANAHNEDRAASESKHIDAIAELQTTIDALQQANSDLNEKIAAAEAEHGENVRKITTEQQGGQEKLKTEHDAVIKSLQDQYAKSLADSKFSTAKLDAELEESAAEKESLRKAHVQQLKDAQVASDESHAHAVATLKSAHDNELKDARAASEKSHADALTALKSTHDAELKRSSEEANSGANEIVQGHVTEITGLKETLSKKDATHAQEVADLKKAVASAELASATAAENHEANIKTLEARAKELEEARSDAEESMKRSIKDRETDVNGLKTELAKAIAAKDAVEKKAAADQKIAQTQAEDMRRKLLALEQEATAAATYQKKAADAEASAEVLQTQLSELTVASTAHQKRADKSEEAHRATEEQLSLVTRRHHEDLEAKEEQLSLNKTTLSAMQDELVAMQQKHADHDKVLQKSRAEYESALDGHQAILKSKDSDIERLNGDIAKYIAAVSAAETSANSQADEAASQQSVTDGLRKELAAIRQEKTDAVTKASADSKLAQQTVDDLQTQLAKAKQQLADAPAAEDHTQLKISVSKLQSQNADLLSARDTHAKAATDAQAQFKESQKAHADVLKTFELTNQSLQSQLADKDTAMQIYRAEAEAAQNDLSSKLDTHTKDKEALQTELATITNEHSALEAELVILKQNHDPNAKEKLQVMTAQVESFEALEKQLREEISAAEWNRDASEEKVGLLEDQLKASVEKAATDSTNHREMLAVAEESHATALVDLRREVEELQAKFVAAPQTKSATGVVTPIKPKDSTETRTTSSAPTAAPAAPVTADHTNMAAMKSSVDRLGDLTDALGDEQERMQDTLKGLDQ